MIKKNLAKTKKKKKKEGTHIIGFSPFLFTILSPCDKKFGEMYCINFLFNGSTREEYFGGQNTYPLHYFHHLRINILVSNASSAIYGINDHFLSMYF